LDLWEAPGGCSLVRFDPSFFRLQRVGDQVYNNLLKSDLIVTGMGISSPFMQEYIIA